MTEDDRFVRTARAKAILRLEQSVLTQWLEGMTLRASAAALQVSRATVQFVRAHLRLTSGQAWKGGVRPLGRSRECRIVVEWTYGDKA